MACFCLVEQEQAFFSESHMCVSLGVNEDLINFLFLFEFPLVLTNPNMLFFPSFSSFWVPPRKLDYSLKSFNSFAHFRVQLSFHWVQVILQELTHTNCHSQRLIKLAFFEMVSSGKFCKKRYKTGERLENVYKRNKRIKGVEKLTHDEETVWVFCFVSVGEGGF